MNNFKLRHICISARFTFFPRAIFEHNIPTGAPRHVCPHTRTQTTTARTDDLPLRAPRRERERVYYYRRRRRRVRRSCHYCYYYYYRHHCNGRTKLGTEKPSPTHVLRARPRRRLSVRATTPATVLNTIQYERPYYYTRNVV